MTTLDISAEAKQQWEQSSDFANYFCTYAYLYHQKQMLQDNLRMRCYYDAIMENKSCFKDKIVLDVGTGSGILSIWAAKAGASRVYAVEATDMAIHARKLVEANQQSDIVTVIQSKIEDVELPEKVDIIISEWMGYFLLRESMLDSVLVARDKWLKEGGALYPSHASIYICPVKEDGTNDKRHQEYLRGVSGWNNFVENTKNEWGVDFSCLTKPFEDEQRQYSLQTSAWCELNPSNLLGEAVCVKSIDISSCTLEEIKTVASSFEFEIETASSLGGFAGWFDVDFHGSLSNPVDKSVTLTTSPFVQPTHWGQQWFPLHPCVQLKDKHQLNGNLHVVRRSDNQRLMNARFQITHWSSPEKKQSLNLAYQME